MRVLALTCVALAPVVAQAQGFADRTDLHKAPSSSNRSSSKPTSSPPTQHHREPDRPRQQHTPPPRQAEHTRQIQREREREAQIERERQHREHQRQLQADRERERREATQLRRERERELRTGVVTSPPRTPEAPRQPVNPPADVVRQPVAVPATAQARAVVCRAAPVCTQPGRSCRPVEWHYTGADAIGSHRRDIARLCEVANTPDSCDCVSQCARAASCAF